MKLKLAVQRGFTLVEIQIALLLLLLIMAALMGSLQLVSKTMSSTESLVEKNADLRIVSNLLRSLSTGATPYQMPRGDENQLVFKGALDEIYFVGNLPEFVVKGGPWLLHIFQDKEQLLLGYRVVDHARSMRDNYEADYEIVVLLDHINIIDFGYLDGATQSWSTVWDNAEIMPDAISVSIEQDGFEWPQLTLPILVKQTTTSYSSSADGKPEDE